MIEWDRKEHIGETSECWWIVKRGKPIDNDGFWYLDGMIAHV